MDYDEGSLKEIEKEIEKIEDEIDMLEDRLDLLKNRRRRIKASIPTKQQVKTWWVVDTPLGNSITITDESDRENLLDSGKPGTAKE